MQPSNEKPSARATRFLPDERTEEKRSLPWNQIVKHFPGRTKGTRQVRYSTKLKDRGVRSLRRGRTVNVTCPAAATTAPQEVFGLLSRSQMPRRKESNQSH
jgi:hypothetical protein